jgi:RNA polymerase sigma-70 factor (ECF subfamily)
MFFKHLNGGGPFGGPVKTGKRLRKWWNSRFRRGDWPPKCSHPDDRSDSFEGQNKMATDTLPQQAKLTGFVDILSASHAIPAGKAKEIYEKNKQRVYSLAFWMTDNELEAEELCANVLCRAFVAANEPGLEIIDRALVSELRKSQPIGTLALSCAEVKDVCQIRGKTKRVHLERAVVQLPATERLIFLLHDVVQRDHASIGRLLGLSEPESRHGLHQARLRMRELLATMI